MSYIERPTRRDSSEHDLHAREAGFSFWNGVAQKAGCLDSECEWAITSISEPDTQASSRLLWQVIVLFERFLAAALLIGSAPIFLTAALMVTILSGRPPFIAHRRVGQHGAELWVLKLRTMWDSRTRDQNLRQWVERLTEEPLLDAAKPAEDARVTSRIAFLCRKYSVDEIPQLWQVVRGEMALVGPRPLTAGEIHKHYGASAPLLYRMKPGLTGLWQVKGRSRLSYRQRRRLDLYMIQRWSLPLYLSILTVTIPRVLLGKDAW
jgi:exopolysaccharide production protein ExoY